MADPQLSWVSVARSVPAGSCRVDQQRSEPLHPPIHAQVIDLDPAFGQQLFDVTVGQVVVRGRPSGEVPAVLVLFPTAPSRTGHDHFDHSALR